MQIVVTQRQHHFARSRGGQQSVGEFVVVIQPSSQVRRNPVFGQTGQSIQERPRIVGPLGFSQRENLFELVEDQDLR